MNVIAVVRRAQSFFLLLKGEKICQHSFCIGLQLVPIHLGLFYMVQFL